MQLSVKKKNVRSVRNQVYFIIFPC